jgi:hypothetical protein
MNRIVSSGRIAVVASFVLGVAACSGSDVVRTSTTDPQDSGPAPGADAAICSTVECGGRCCSAGQTCQSGQCTDPGPSCPISFSDSTCESCFTASCGSACGACAGNTECEAALTCYASCTTSSCASACLTGLSATTDDLLGAMFGDPNGCVYSSCRSECTTPARNGDPCLVSADCESGECAGDGVHEGWCTIQGCTTNVQCGIDTAGELVWCGEVSGGGYECFPGCSSDADCSGFYCESTGYAATCGSDLSVNGNDGNICGCW